MGCLTSCMHECLNACMPSPTITVTLRLPPELYGQIVDVMDRDGSIRSMNAYIVRALESALGKTAPAPKVPLQDSAQTRASEESSRSSRHSSSSDQDAQVSVGESPKESASPGPARSPRGSSSEGEHEGASPQSGGSGRGPRRSEDAKRNVKPIQRTAK